MTENSRKKFSDAQNVALVSQVSSVCPLCDRPLFYMKGGRSHKAYEIAHIFPLNPSPEELAILKDEERLGDGDLNHEDNVIPLCESCHGRFDKPRTVSEYRELLATKKQLVEGAGQQELWSNYSIEEDILSVINGLYSDDSMDSDAEIDYEPKQIDEKLDRTITRLTARKIKNNVSDYYTSIRRQLVDIDRISPGTSEAISLQFKLFYLKQKQRDISQQAVFDNMVKWVFVKTRPQTVDAAEIIVSFFVQNCEVFE